MLNKTRVVTAVIMLIVLIPFIFLGGYFIYGLCAVLGFIGTYELVKMHNDKNNLPKILNYIVPLLSLAVVLVVMMADLVLKIDGFKFIIFSILLISVVLLISSLVYSELKVSDAFYYIGSILYGGASFGVVAAIRNIEVFSNQE